MVSRWSYCATFTYEPDVAPGELRTALGTMCSWENLSIELNRQGNPCPAEKAIHFKTISALGPKLFAVSLSTSKVFYHYGDQWHQYQTATSIRLGTMEELMKFLNNEDDDGDESESQEDNDGKDRDDNEPGRQSKETSTSNYDSKHQINQAILYYCLLKMILSAQIEFYSIQYQSLVR